ncbi:unnamed protein product, partial [Rotaria magnacalcarata]
MKNQELETRLLEQDRRLADQSSLIHELTSKVKTRQAEMKNQELETRLLEQDRRLADQSSLIHELTSKMSSQNQIIDRINDSNYSFDDDYRGLQQKIDGLQRQMITLEEDNGNLLRNLSAKEEALRNAQ